MDRRQRAARRATMAEAAKTDHPQEVADKFRVSITTVLDACREAGTPFVGQRKLYILELLADLCNTTTPLMQLARKYKRRKEAVWTLYRNARRAGLPVQRRPLGRPKNAS